MYTDINFKTKKALKEALASGRMVTVYQPGPFGHSNIHSSTLNGTVTVEGPHFPEPHKWYARVLLKDGAIERIVA